MGIIRKRGVGGGGEKKGGVVYYSSLIVKLEGLCSYKKKRSKKASNCDSNGLLLLLNVDILGKPFGVLS